MTTAKKGRLIFITPEIGLSDSCQLMVNLAIAAKNENKTAEFYICSKYHENVFPEMKNGILPIKEHFAWLPDSLFGKFILIFAMIKIYLLTLWVILFAGKADIYILNVNCHSLPLLWLFRKKSLFYCHFQDDIITQPEKSIIARMNHKIKETIEEFSLFFASKIIVNSKYTQEKFYEAFSTLQNLKINPEIIHPSVDFSKLECFESENENEIEKITQKRPYFFSLNKFEENKNFELAIESFYEFKKLVEKNDRHILIIAGKFSESSAFYLEKLKNLTDKLQLSERIIFLKNISHVSKVQFLKNNVCFLYTPENEQFGMIPVEAMYMERPVIGQNNSELIESVAVNSGFLLTADSEEWAKKMKIIASDDKIGNEMGKNGRKHVLSKFSFEVFQKEFNQIILNMLIEKNKKLF